MYVGALIWQQSVRTFSARTCSFPNHRRHLRHTLPTLRAMASGSKPTPRDVILPMTFDYMSQIVRGEKTYEFRRYRIAPSVERIWFYITAPMKEVKYLCEIDPARTRKRGDEPLEEDGVGNKEFNERHEDWAGYDFAYRLRSLYMLKAPIKLAELKEKYGIKAAPRGLVYTPEALLRDVKWKDQICMWDDEETRKKILEIFTRSAKRRLEGEDVQGWSTRKTKKQVRFQPFAWEHDNAFVTLTVRLSEI